MKHRRGIDIVRDGADVGYTVGEGSRRGSGSEPPDAPYRIEVWTDAPEAGGELLETISRSTVFAVSCAALRAAVRERPGKTLIHLNQRHRMTCERAPDPPVPEFTRPLQPRRRPQKKPSTSYRNGTFSSAPVLRAVGAALWRDATSSVQWGERRSCQPFLLGSVARAARINRAIN